MRRLKLQPATEAGRQQEVEVYEFAIVVLLGIGVFKLVDMLNEYVDLTKVQSILTIALGAVVAWALEFSLFALCSTEGLRARCRDHRTSPSLRHPQGRLTFQARRHRRAPAPGGSSLCLHVPKRLFVRV
jgi:hypothetical protein